MHKPKYFTSIRRDAGSRKKTSIIANVVKKYRTEFDGKAAKLPIADNPKKCRAINRCPLFALHPPSDARQILVHKTSRKVFSTHSLFAFPTIKHGFNHFAVYFEPSERQQSFPSKKNCDQRQDER